MRDYNNKYRHSTILFLNHFQLDMQFIILYIVSNQYGKLQNFEYNLDLDRVIIFKTIFFKRFVHCLKRIKHNMFKTE